MSKPPSPSVRAAEPDGQPIPRKVRLGRGEVVGAVELQARARAALCVAIEAACPDVLDALAALSPDVGRVEFMVWSRRFNLDAAWVRDYAEMTLDAWEHLPEHRGRRWFGFDRGDWAMSNVPDKPFEATFTAWQGWTPSWERRKDARRWLLASFRDWVKTQPQAIDAYLDAVESAHRAAFEEDRTEHSATPTARDREHYRWAALYLCGDNGDKAPGWPFERIAEHVGAERQTVQGAVSPVLAELGLRARRPGRPRKR